jgi:hypothetical protein
LAPSVRSSCRESFDARTALYPCRDLSRILAAICKSIARVLLRANGRRFLAERVVLLSDYPRQKSAITMNKDRAVLSVVKALASLDPAGCRLDDTSAQLEGRTYVMADEAPPYFLR